MFKASYRYLRLPCGQTQGYTVFIRSRKYHLYINCLVFGNIREFHKLQKTWIQIHTVWSISLLSLHSTLASFWLHAVGTSFSMSLFAQSLLPSILMDFFNHLTICLFIQLIKLTLPHHLLPLWILIILILLIVFSDSALSCLCNQHTLHTRHSHVTPRPV